MAKDFSQAEPAQLYLPSEDAAISDSGSVLKLRGLQRVFGPKAADVEQPFPAVTPDLVSRIILVSKAIAHAAEHRNLKGASELIVVSSAYNDVVKSEIDALRNKPDRAPYWAASKTYSKSAETAAEHQGRLQVEFSVAGSGRASTVSRFFHSRNNLADQYIWKNRSEPELAPLLVKT